MNLSQFVVSLPELSTAHLVCVDFDGTIFPARGFHVSSFGVALMEIGLQADATVSSSDEALISQGLIFGNDSLAISRALLERRRSDADPYALTVAKRAAMERLLASKTIDDSTAAALRALGVLRDVCIVSRGLRGSIEDVLARSALDICVVARGSRDQFVSKRDLLFQAIETFAVSPQDCMYIADSLGDEEIAHSLGVNFFKVDAESEYEFRKGAD